MLADTLQDIDEISVRIDAVQSAGDDQTLRDADLLGAEFGPTEVPVFSPHRNRAQPALQVVRVDRHVRIAQEDLKPEPPFSHVLQRLRERIARQQSLSLALPATHSKN